MLIVIVIGGVILVVIAVAVGRVEGMSQRDAWSKIAVERRELGRLRRALDAGDTSTTMVGTGRSRRPRYGHGALGPGEKGNTESQRREHAWSSDHDALLCHRFRGPS